jgi:hypothetical protein
MLKPKTIEDLNTIYQQAETCDKEIFAEQRSNVLLISGDHYTNKGARDRIRDSKELSPQQKLRLTKNHIQKITKAYVNNIVEAAPGVQVTPRNDTDLGHQKAAALNQAVWQYAKDTQKLESRVLDWAKDYIDLGECFVKVYFDPMKGKFLGYNQAVDPLTGEPELEDDGVSLKADKANPKFQGELTIEKLLACNVLRSPEAQTMEDSPVIIIRKMENTKVFEGMIANDPEFEDKKKFIQAGGKEEYMVFDTSTGSYQQNQKDQVLVMEYYFRPSPECPMGYYYITTRSGILFSGVWDFPDCVCGLRCDANISSSPLNRETTSPVSDRA